MGTLDLKSAYPFQMALLPDPVTVEMIPAPEKRYARDAAGQAAFVAEWRGKYGVLYVSGEALDPIMPAFRMHDEARGGRLRYVFGRFEHAAVTIPELVIGVLRGALRIDRVGKPPTRGMPGFWMRGNAETSFLREGIRAFFSIKEDAQNEQALRDMAKLLMNSAYGKFIEIKRGEYLVSELFPMPRFQKKRAVCGTIARLFASSGALAPGMYFGEEGAEEDKAREIYAANVRADSSPAEAVVAYVEALDAAGVARTGSESIKVRDYVRGEKRYDCGHYFLPAYASQITGATSAMVGLMAHVVGALQGDTDSVHVPIPTGMRKIGEVKAKERYFEIMAAAGYPSPRVVVSAEGKHELVGGVPGLGKIGIWEEECPDPSEESILVRPKLYSHKFVAEHQFKDQKSGEPICKTCKLTFHESVELNHDDFCTIYKQAKHGFAKFHDPLVEEIQRSRGARDSRGRKMAHARKIRLHEAMRNLLTTGSHEYRTRSAPRRLRAAIAHGLTVGEFTSEPMKMILTPDPNTERGEGGETRWKRL